MTDSIKKQDIGQISDWFEERPVNKANRQRLAQIIDERLSFVGIEWAASKEVRMLDYACGPGFLSKIFAQHVSSIKAVDAAPEMIDRYKTNIDSCGLAPGKAEAVVGNLLSDPPSLVGEEYRGFDLITLGAALHHFPSAADAVRLLAERLKPGGVLYIQDLHTSHDEHGAAKSNGDGKRPYGYEEADVRGFMHKAGLSDFKFEKLPGNLKIELPNEEVLDFECFIARGAKVMV